MLRLTTGFGFVETGLAAALGFAVSSFGIVSGGGRYLSAGKVKNEDTDFLCFVSFFSSTGFIGSSCCLDKASVFFSEAIFKIKETTSVFCYLVTTLTPSLFNLS